MKAQQQRSANQNMHLRVIVGINSFVIRLTRIVHVLLLPKTRQKLPAHPHTDAKLDENYPAPRNMGLQVGLGGEQKDLKIRAALNGSSGISLLIRRARAQSLYLTDEYLQLVHISMLRQ